MRFSLFLLFIVFVSAGLYGQGCSDAGACSAGSPGLEEIADQDIGLTISYSQSLGLADKESLVLKTEVLASHRIFPALNFEVRIPYQVTIGNLATTSGVGDLLPAITYRINKNINSSFSIIAGGRLKTNDANKKSGDDPLPMVYQSSLGTNDMIAGIAWQSQKWSLSMAYQHPFGANKNEYLQPDSADLPDRKLYYESAFLKRGDDLLVRIQRTVTLNSQSTINFGFLPIYRIQKDEIKRDGKYESLPGSNGITYNLFFNWFREIKKYMLFSFTAGFPVHAREYRADGLTRTALISAGLIFQFHSQKSSEEPAKSMFEPLKIK